MSDEEASIGTRYIANVEPHEEIVELRKDGWYKGIFDDDKRGWEVAPSRVETALAGREFCENYIGGLRGRSTKLNWIQVGNRAEIGT